MRSLVMAFFGVVGIAAFLVAVCRYLSPPRKTTAKEWRVTLAVLIVGILCILVMFAVNGCATAPHPLLRALAPSNVLHTIADTGELQVTGSMTLAHFPYLPNSFVKWETQGNTTIVTVRPPFNTDEFAAHYARELEKRGHRNVRIKKEGSR